MRVIGGMGVALSNKVFITPIACALTLGIATNFVLNKFKKQDNNKT